MKIVYVTPFLRVPPDFGIAIRNYHILKHLTTRHAVTVVAYGVDDTGETDAWLRGRGARVVRLEHAFLWSGARGRMMTLKNLLMYPPASFQRFAPDALQRTLDAMAGRTEIDVLVLDTALTGQAALTGKLPGTAVLSLPDIYQRLLRQETKATGMRPYKAVSLVNRLKTQRYENRILRQYSRLIAVSSTDFQFLKRRFPGANVTLIPNGVDPQEFAPQDGVSPSYTLLFVGNFHYAPNADAFFYFCREILPRVRARCPEIKFVAAGRNPTAEMSAYAEGRPEIELAGGVPDVRPYYARSAVVVVPLRYGGGIKLKTLEAFAAGVPVVSTSAGAEGIDAQDGEHFLAADEPETFAVKIMELLKDASLRVRLTRNARALVERKYDWKVVCERMEEFLNTV